MRFAQMELKLTLAKLLTKYRLHHENEPIGDTYIATVTVNPTLQRIRDPLLARVDEI